VNVEELRGRLRSALGARLELGDPLGTGGFAAVFRAHDPVLHRDVAVKALDPGLALGDAADRLLDEARLVAAAEHPHIVPLYEAGFRDDVVFLIMRYFPDGTVGARLAREGALPPAEVARLGTEIADALATAHARGVVHLDIKPDNILLDADGHAAVADFGIARLTAGAARTGAAESGPVSGTPHYMSPEQVAGDRIDGRSDIYALGVVLYELATGQRPVTGDSAAKVMANQVSQAPPPLTRVAPELPAALSSVITRALAKDPAERWASARDMADALRAASAADQLLSPRQARRRTQRRWFGRSALIIGGLVGGMALLGYAAFRLYAAFSEGEPPALDAMAPLIPTTVLDSLQALGALTPGDTVLYVFVPHGHGVRDAIVATSRDLVSAGGGAPRRYANTADYHIDLRRTSGQGFLIIRLPGSTAADTLYRGLSGLELRVLGLALSRTLR
jgi:serine/threonine-protein kinase